MIVLDFGKRSEFHDAIENMEEIRTLRDTGSHGGGVAIVQADVFSTSFDPLMVDPQQTLDLILILQHVCTPPTSTVL